MLAPPVQVTFVVAFPLRALIKVTMSSCADAGGLAATTTTTKPTSNTNTQWQTHQSAL
jgi:hypothetical protein